MLDRGFRLHRGRSAKPYDASLSLSCAQSVIDGSGAAGPPCTCSSPRRAIARRNGWPFATSSIVWRTFSAGRITISNPLMATYAARGGREAALHLLEAADTPPAAVTVLGPAANASAFYRGYA